MSRRKQAQPIQYFHDEENPLGTGPIPSDKDHQALSSSIGGWRHHPIANTQIAPSFTLGRNSTCVIVSQSAGRRRLEKRGLFFFPLPAISIIDMMMMTNAYYYAN